MAILDDFRGLGVRFQAGGFYDCSRDRTGSPASMVVKMRDRLMDWASRACLLKFGEDFSELATRHLGRGELSWCGEIT
jgi:hypothetical protein